MALIGKRIIIAGADFSDVAVEFESFRLDSIQITTAPTRVVYRTGEVFSTEGMVVKANFIGQTTGATYQRTITDYTYFPMTPFDTEGPKTITIAYVRGGITKTATVAINVSNTEVDWKDVPVYKNKTYREIFIDSNLVPSINSTFGTPDFEGTVQWASLAKPVATTENFYTGPTGIKAFGSNSVQSFLPLSLVPGNTYLVATKKNVTRFVKGIRAGAWLGTATGSGTEYDATHITVITDVEGTGTNASAVTDGWITGITLNTMPASGNGKIVLYVGTGGSANMDAYIDDIYVVDLTAVFGAGNLPTLAEITEVYEQFIEAVKSNS